MSFDLATACNSAATYLTREQVRETFPGPASAEWVRKAILHGIRAQDGEIVKLKALKVGKKWWIRAEDLREFRSRLGFES